MYLLHVLMLAAALNVASMVSPTFRLYFDLIQYEFLQ